MCIIARSINLIDFFKSSIANQSGVIHNNNNQAK